MMHTIRKLALAVPVLAAVPAFAQEDWVGAINDSVDVLWSDSLSDVFNSLAGVLGLLLAGGFAIVVLFWAIGKIRRGIGKAG